ncbi:HAMP domain-containing sensor histidine kinase [Tistrella mobilis]|uniref:sensor histidine kinase n=1 Tax=Tistrella mobilis TaxID=171437 RepID=UPI003557164A
MGERDIRDGLRNARVAMEAELSRRAAIATFPGAAAAAALMWPYVDHLWTIGWVVLMWAISAIRIPSAVLVLRAAEADAVTEAQRIMIAGGIAVASFGWGLGVAIGLTLDNPGATMIAISVLLAISSVGIAYVMDRAMLLAFMVPLAIPPIALLLVRHEGQDVSVAICYILYLIVFGNFAGRHHRWIADMLRLNIENRQLLDRQARDAGRIRALVDELTVTNARLERSLHDAQAANDAKSRFLAQVSHELRTPLNAILGYSEIIRDQLFGSDAATFRRYSEQAGYIHQSGQMLKALIEDLLDVARIESGRTDVEISTVDLARAIEGALTAIRPQAAAKRQSLLVDLPPGLPAVAADHRALGQILNNLLGNAVKFTPEDGHIAVAARRTSEPGRQMIAITVSDDGIGIPPEAIDRVFEPFERGGNVVRRSIEGTGLGLAISRRLAEAMDGSVTIERQRRVGTAITLRLPVA